jgi:hypothetical protein
MGGILVHGIKQVNVHGNFVPAVTHFFHFLVFKVDDLDLPVSLWVGYVDMNV